MHRHAALQRADGRNQSGDGALNVSVRPFAASYRPAKRSLSLSSTSGLNPSYRRALPESSVKKLIQLGR